MNEARSRLSRLADRFAAHLYRNAAVYEMDCIHCDHAHFIPARHVIVQVTAYARESYATARCPHCRRVVAQEVTIEEVEGLINVGAKFRAFHELPPLTEKDIDRFAAALEDADIIELAEGNR